MTAAILNEPFVIHTFVESRGAEPERVFHAIGTDDTWMPKSRRYIDHLQRTEQSSTNRYAHNRYASLRHAIIHIECCLERFLVFANREALDHHDQVIPDTVWWAHPNTEEACWIRMHPEDIAIVNFSHIPDDHRDTVPHTLRGVIDRRPLNRILGDLQNEYHLPDFLISIQDDILEYEATVHLPKADTVAYNRLREELVRQEMNAL